MTCNDCLHRKACGDELEECAEKCKFFLNREEYVRVVRCKDCAFATDEGMSGIYCDHPDHRNPVGCRETDFCDEGIRREDLPEAEEEEEAFNQSLEAAVIALGGLRHAISCVFKAAGEAIIALSKAVDDVCEEDSEGTYSAAEEDEQTEFFRKEENARAEDEP